MRFSLRPGCADHSDPDYIDRLIVCIRRNGNCFDEVWLATSYGILSEAEYTADAGLMALAADKFRAAGIAASIQVSRTVGHHPSALTSWGAGGVQPDFGCVTAEDGRSNPGVYCWNSEPFRSYVRKLLAVYAERVQPEKMWLDDDIRLRLIGPSKALCYCDRCVSLFNERVGTSFDRPSLCAELRRDPALREQYIAFQTETLADFVGDFSEAVRAVSPKTVLALQNGGNTILPILSQRACLDRMYEVTGIAPDFRAGGGFYNDHSPENMIPKSLTLNYMNERLPGYVRSRSCEIENLPFSAYGKSPECTCLEAALYLAVGCNEASVTLMNQSEPLDWHDRMFRRIAQYRPYCDRYAEHNRNTVSAGIAVYQPPRSVYIPQDGEKPFWNESCIHECVPLMRWGLPFHAGLTGSAYYITPKTVDFLTADDLAFLLTQPVLTDAPTLDKLARLGLPAPRVTLSPLNSADEDSVDEYSTDCPENGSLRFEKLRAAADGVCHALTGDAITPLSRLVGRLTKNEVGAGMAVVPTGFGADWAVSALPFSGADQSFARRELVRNALETVTGGLPAEVASPEQLVILPRKNADGKTVSVFLMNTSLTDTDDFEVAVRNPADSSGCTLIDPYRGETRLPFNERGGVYYVTLPSLRAWRVCSILT